MNLAPVTASILYARFVVAMKIFYKILYFVLENRKVTLIRAQAGVKNNIYKEIEQEYYSARI